MQISGQTRFFSQRVRSLGAEPGDKVQEQAFPLAQWLRELR